MIVLWVVENFLTIFVHLFDSVSNVERLFLAIHHNHFVKNRAIGGDCNTWSVVDVTFHVDFHFVRILYRNHIFDIGILHVRVHPVFEFFLPFSYDGHYLEKNSYRKKCSVRNVSALIFDIMKIRKRLSNFMHHIIFHIVHHLAHIHINHITFLFQCFDLVVVCWFRSFRYPRMLFMVGYDRRLSK